MSNQNNSVEAPQPLDDRAAILQQSNRVKTIRLQFFGRDIDIRQPTLGEIMDFRVRGATDEGAAAVDMVMRFTYKAGTNQRLFEETDRELLKGLPFDENFRRVTDVITKLMGVDVQIEEQEKNLGTAPSLDRPSE